MFWVVDNSHQRYSFSTRTSFCLVSSITLLRLGLIEICYARNVNELKFRVCTILPITSCKVPLLEV